MNGRPTPSIVDRTTASGTTVADLIVASARREVAAKGVLGLRVAEVAAGAHCSVTQIYRYFGDRNGLLARVLGDLYEELVSRTTADFHRTLPEGPLTIDDVVAALPRPSVVAASGAQAIRMQILAVAANNPELYERLSTFSRTMLATWKAILADIQRRLPPGTVFDERAFTIGVVNMNLFYNELLGPDGADDEQFLAWVRHTITAVS